MKLTPSLSRIVLAFLASLTLVVVGAHRSSADQRDFRVVNETSYTINNLYVSPHASDNWGHDVLGSYVLKPGQTTKVTFSDDLGYCYYDIKAVYSDGTKSEKYNVNLCHISIFRFHE